MKKVRKEKNIVLNEKGNFRVRFILYGYSVDKTFKTQEEAILFKKAKIKEIERMKDENISYDNHDITFGEAFNEMLENQKDKNGNEIKKSNYYQFKDETINNYKKTFNNHLKPLELITLKSLTVAKINQVLNLIPQIKNDKLSNVQYRTKIVISKVIDYAEDNNYIFRFPKNYGRGVKKYGGKNEFSNRNNYITENTLITIINNISNLSESHMRILSNEDIKFIFMLFFYTGLRCGEARGLKVSDFKIINNQATINVERQMIEGSQKIDLLKGNHEARIVYLKQEIFQYFNNYFKYKNYNYDNYVFDFLKTGEIISRQKISRMMKRVIKNLKDFKILNDDVYDEISPQVLRISNTHYLESIGASEKLSASIQGHTIATQQKYYEVVSDDKEKIFGKIIV